MLNLKINKDIENGSEDNNIQAKPTDLRIDKMPFTLLSIFIFLLPIFFLPSNVATIVSTKMLLLHIVVIASLFIIVLLRLKDQSFKAPFNLFSLSILLVPVIVIFSGIFSENRVLSFFGRDFGVDSVLSMISLFLLTTIVVLQFKNSKRVIQAYSLLVLSFAIVFLIQILLIVFPQIPNLGFFSNNITTTLGKWNDLSILATLMVIISMTASRFLELKKRIKLILNIVLGASIIMLVLVNFTFAWYGLAVFTLVLFVYTTVMGHKVNKTPTISFQPLLIFLISFLFIIAGDNLGGYVSNVLKINHFEVRPSWSATYGVIKGTIAERPILGSGAGLFEMQWLEHKPNAVNNTDFWNIDFRYGVGLIPSFIVTTGILGLLSWLFFFIMFIHIGFKAIFRRRESVLNHFVLVSSFIASLYLWISLIAYIPSAAIIILTFIFTGIFIAAAQREGLLATKEFSMIDQPRSGFVYITILILILIGSISLAYNVVNKFVAQAYLQSAIANLNTRGDMASAERKITQAINLDKIDTYYRSLAEIGVLKLNTILRNSELSEDVILGQFRSTLSSVASNYQRAIEYDPNNYNTYRDFGNLYYSMIPFGITGAYDQSLVMLNLARELNPKNPGLALQLARLEVANGNNERALELIEEALTLKGNYTDAIFLLSQIQVAEGNIDNAISTVEVATIIRPNDPAIFFQLGLLQYNDDQFSKAISSFERTLLLSPFFQNAKYFLGLSYYETNRRDDAIVQFNDLQALNPDNQEINLILTNLKNGFPPFSGAQDPIDDTPESRDEPPLEDENVENTEGLETEEVGNEG